MTRDEMLDSLHRKENEIARLTGALLRIAAIKNELDGDDWSEIEQARQIARAAVKRKPNLDSEFDYYANEDHMGQGG